MKVLDKLVKAVESQKSSESKGKGWMKWIPIVLSSLFGMFLSAWIQYKDGRELAKLRHEKTKRLVEKRQAEVAAAVASHEEVLAGAMMRVSEAKERIEQIDFQIEEALERHEKNLAQIDRLRWSDLPSADE